VNQLRRGSDRDQGPQANCFPCTKSPDGLQEGQEGPLTSLRLASGSTRTSIWRSWSAPSIKWLKDHCYDLVLRDCWPPSSPDLNPLDYFVWGYLGTHTNQRAHTTKASPITSIKENFASMDKAMVAKTCVAFRGWVEAVIEAEGGFFE
jgi:hypothetical protein